MGVTFEHADYWISKLRKDGPIAVGRRATDVAVRILATLVTSGLSELDVDKLPIEDIGDRSDRLGGVALLYRCGVLSPLPTSKLDGLRFAFDPTRLEHRKSSTGQQDRGRFAVGEKLDVFDADGHRCSVCGEEFVASALQVDHVVPLTLLGADSWSNWVATCGPDNRARWRDLYRRPLRWYRDEKVAGTVTLCAAQGRLWPVINAVERIDRRSGGGQ